MNEKNKPVSVTEAEVIELNNFLNETGDFYGEVDVNDYYVAKFPKYITDGPGYAGELFVIVWGVPATTMVTRNRDGTLHIEESGA